VEAVTGQTFGYTRVSTLDRNTIRQLDGQQHDKVFRVCLVNGASLVKRQFG